MVQVFPELKEAKIEYAWSGNICLTRDFFPRAGQHDGLYYALGYGGHGVAMATYLGGQLANIMCGAPGKNPFKDLPFEPLPFYYGKPFMPLGALYYKLLDVISNQGSGSCHPCRRIILSWLCRWIVLRGLSSSRSARARCAPGDPDRAAASRRGDRNGRAECESTGRHGLHARWPSAVHRAQRAIWLVRWSNGQCAGYGLSLSSAHRRRTRLAGSGRRSGLCDESLCLGLFHQADHLARLRRNRSRIASCASPSTTTIRSPLIRQGQAVFPSINRRPAYYVSIHNGGNLHFGPDGKLYIGVGNSNEEITIRIDPAQDLASPLGKIHRYNPTVPLSVPADNPFVTWPGPIRASTRTGCAIRSISRSIRSASKCLPPTTATTATTKST